MSRQPPETDSGDRPDTDAARDHPTPAEAVARVVAATWRIEAAKIIAALTRHVGDFGFAEDLAQEAVAEALASWPESGIPRNPAGWLMTVAKRRAIDTWRRRERFDERLAVLGRDLEDEQDLAGDDLPWDPDEITDDVLRLIFISCHPVLGREARLALTLRVVGGLSTEEIARAFLVPVPTIQQRIVRAKKALTAAEVPFALPPAGEWPKRLSAVLTVLYLMFSEGHVATSGPDWMKPALAMDALRLTRVTAGLLPREPEVHGLVALMALTAVRFPSRLGPRGEPVLLADQDRSRWDRSLIRLGEASLRTAHTMGERRGPYTLQAEIAAVHARSRTIADTDWERIAALYAELEALAPSPVTALNRAIALAEARGPEEGLRCIDGAGLADALGRHHHAPSVRGELLARLGRTSEAIAEFDRAAELTTNDGEREVLRAKAEALRDTGTAGA